MQIDFKQYGKWSPSPLQYPGSKFRLAKKILPYFPENPEVMYSPFIGGGAIEIMIQDLGIEVIGSDIDPRLVNFYKWVKREPESISDYALTLAPMANLEARRKYLKEFRETKLDDTLEYTQKYYVANRISFSGNCSYAGTNFLYIGATNHFNRDWSEALRYFYAPNLSVVCQDFRDFISRIAQDDFIYLDPPYVLGKSQLYGIGYKDNHTKFDHQLLRNLLETKNNWVLSYNDCEYIRRLYSGYRMVELERNKSFNDNSKNGIEILILSQ